MKKIFDSAEFVVNSGTFEIDPGAAKANEELIMPVMSKLLSSCLVGRVFMIISLTYLFAEAKC